MDARSGLAVELAPGITGLGQKKGGRVHAFLLDDGQSLTLIDTLYDTDGHRVVEELAKADGTELKSAPVEGRSFAYAIEKVSTQ